MYWACNRYLMMTKAWEYFRHLLLMNCGSPISGVVTWTCFAVMFVTVFRWHVRWMGSLLLHFRALTSAVAVVCCSCCVCNGLSLARFELHALDHCFGMIHCCSHCLSCCVCKGLSLAQWCEIVSAHQQNWTPVARQTAPCYTLISDNSMLIIRHDLWSKMASHSKYNSLLSV